MKHLNDKLQGFNRVYTATTIDKKFYMCVCVRVCVCVYNIYIFYNNKTKPVNLFNPLWQ